ncbi:ABC transporter ATP-binding protein [Jeotgalibacillus sp. R-1-5s-1]|uniref:ABC transporter ATP-binding protein n=1 Tax=Jeotgalibacillus sp. R-1-5s-1 TaxID=2555897 RepID=UPI00106DA19A|nr:ABC transporter ATP-binding protein [Jeotgalibacillus sp. R-1-5s-1]TFD92867.1 ABC transporter ATP-binding protein [Jeotgalibacillus sp. R-1-5s-1]
MKAKETKKPVQWQAFLGLLKQLKWPKWITIFALLFALIETVVSLIIPLVTRDLVNTVTGAAISWSTLGLLIGVFLVQGITGGVSYYMLAYIGETIVADLREKLWRHIIRLPIPYFDQHESGETMSRITQDTSTVKQLITGHLVTFVSGIISVIGSVLLLLYIDWRMTLILLISVPVTLLIIMPLGRMMYRISKSVQDEMASFSGLLGRVLSEVRLVKAYSAEEKEAAKGSEGIQTLFRFGLKEAKIQAVISPVMTFVMMALLVVILGYGGLQVSSGALSAGDLVAIIFYLFQIVVPFTQMANFFTAFQKAVGATERIQAILEITPEPSIKSKQTAGAYDHLTFSDVSFRYNEKKSILSSLSFTVPAGKMTAFVGPSGGGKTTIFSLVERFYTPVNGTITYGEQSIDRFPLEEWRRRIGYVSQESPLMSGTIKENITYGLKNEVPDDVIKAAAAAANASDFIEALPDQYDTEVGERGIRLSGGQRQRIAIARALILDPEILLLDEATSNLDSSSEILVQEALQRLMEGRTTLVIAHRLSTVLHAYQIIFIENGKATGSGTHHQLYTTHDLYRQFADGQSLIPSVTD